jgi:hypothetical protein
VHRDRAPLLKLWRGNLGTVVRWAEKYDWFYLACPWGEPMVRVLRHAATAEWVGVAAVGPRRVRWNGREIRAGLLVDMAVDASHRSLGPALMLQRAVLEDALSVFDLVYGFPNPKAIPVVKRVGYKKLADMVRCSRVLRHGPYLRRLLPAPLAALAGSLIDVVDRLVDGWRWLLGSRLIGTWHDEAETCLHELRIHDASSDGLVGVRDRNALHWRFDAVSFARVRYFVVRERNHSRAQAWFACQEEGATLHVRDFAPISRPGTMSRRALDALIRAARARGHSALSVQYAGSEDGWAPWKAARFVERDRRPIYGAWREWLPEEIAVVVHFTPADEDE